MGIYFFIGLAAIKTVIIFCLYLKIRSDAEVYRKLIKINTNLENQVKELSKNPKKFDQMKRIHESELYQIVNWADYRYKLARENLLMKTDSIIDEAFELGKRSAIIDWYEVLVNNHVYEWHYKEEEKEEEPFAPNLFYRGFYFKNPKKKSMKLPCSYEVANEKLLEMRNNLSKLLKNKEDVA